MLDSPDLLMRIAEVELTRAFNRPVNLVSSTFLASPHMVLRCQIAGVTSGLDSVILKQVMSTEFTDSVIPGTSHRLLNEWAALRFLEDLETTPSNERPWPRLLAANREHSLVIIEDLGAHPTVEEMLVSSDQIGAAASLAALGSTLGTFHAAAHTTAAEFPRVQSGVGAASPRSDSNFDVRNSADAFGDCFDVLGMAPHDDFWPAVEELEAIIHTPGEFHTLIHADAGPQNFLWTGASAPLIDYEFATFGHGLLDLVSARLGFPHTTNGRTVPIRHVEEIELRYRNAAAPTMRGVGNDTVFSEGICDVSAHWALVRWAVRWRHLFREEPSEEADAEKVRSRAETFTVYRRFLATAAASGRWEPISQTVEAYCDALQRRHPGLEETRQYPVLTIGS